MASSSAIQLADIALVWSNATGDADLSFIDSDVASDRDLETAVLLSLFTDRRANDDDVPPSGDAKDRRGWWGDAFADVEGDLFGSRIWLLNRSKLTNETVLLATQYAKEALQWMLDDQVIASVGVDVSMLGGLGNGGLPQKGLLFAVTLPRPGRDPVTFRFAHVWDHVQEDV